MIGLLVFVGILYCLRRGESALFFLFFLFFLEGKGCCSLAFHQCVMDSRGDQKCSKLLRIVIRNVKDETNLRAGGTGLTKFVLLHQKSRQNLSQPTTAGALKNSKIFVYH